MSPSTRLGRSRKLNAPKTIRLPCGARLNRIANRAICFSKSQIALSAFAVVKRRPFLIALWSRVLR